LLIVEYERRKVNGRKHFYAKTKIKLEAVEYYQPIHIAKKKKIEVHSGDNTKGVAEHPLDKKISKSVTHR